MARPPGVNWDPSRKAWYTTSIGEIRRTKAGKPYRTKVWNHDLPKADKLGAMAWLARRMEEQDRAKSTLSADDPTFERLCECYLQSAEKVGNLAPESRACAADMLTRFGEWPRSDHPGRMDLRKARSIGPDDLKRFVADLLGGGLTEAYVCGGLIKAVKSCYSWASKVQPGEYGGLPLASNPVASYKPPRTPRRAERPATAAQVDAFLAWNRRRVARMKAGSIPKRFARVAHLLLMTLRETGCRPKELCSAEWTEWSVLPDGWGVIRLPWKKWKNGEKTRRERLILVPPRCARRIERVRNSPDRHPTHLFTHRSTQERPGAESAPDSPAGIPWVADYREGNTKLLQVWFRRLRKTAIGAGVDLPPKFRLYWLRSLYSTEAQRKGSNKAILAKAMGTSERMLDVSYTDLDLNDMLEVAKHVAGRSGISPSEDA